MMSNISPKRTLSDVEDESIKQATKRRRLETTTRQAPLANAQQCNRSISFDEHPRELLLRSISLVLEHVGFEGAYRPAMESFLYEVDIYMTRLLSQVTSCMLLARRGQPIALDFEYALSQFQIPRLSLQPHLRPTIKPPKIQLLLADPPEPLFNSKVAARLFGRELNGDMEKASKTFIPKRFPGFPSKHTYKWTEKVTCRETDPRKIREQAAKGARQGEDALRKIMKVSKAMEEKNLQKSANTSLGARKRHELWERTMFDFLKDTPPGKNIEEDDRCMIVNSEKKYWRKPVQKTKATSKSNGDQDPTEKT